MLRWPSPVPQTVSGLFEVLADPGSPERCNASGSGGDVCKLLLRSSFSGADRRHQSGVDVRLEVIPSGSRPTGLTRECRRQNKRPPRMPAAKNRSGMVNVPQGALAPAAQFSGTISPTLALPNGCSGLAA